jgi:hypothetical protein
MSQKNSGYAKKPNEEYLTPSWVYELLYDEFPMFKGAIDPCPPAFTMDWLETLQLETIPVAVATNPPFSMGQEIAEWCLVHGFPAALLLPATWDCATDANRIRLCREMHTKIIITRRIRWTNVEQRATPSSNHAWYVWLGNYKSEPTMRWR